MSSGNVVRRGHLAPPQQPRSISELRRRGLTIRKTSAARRNSHWAEQGIGTWQADGAVDPLRPRPANLDIIWGDWRSGAIFCKLDVAFQEVVHSALTGEAEVVEA